MQIESLRGDLDGSAPNLQSYFERTYTATEQRMLPRLVEMRLNATPIDMMIDAAKYSPQEMKLMTQSMTFFSLVDGCTGPCAWCGWMAKKTISRAVSFDSYTEYLKIYGKYLPPISLFGATDPFDVRDGTHGYQDYFQMTQKLAPRSAVFTSTAIPLGTESEIARFIEECLFPSWVNGSINTKSFRISVNHDANGNSHRVDALLFYLKKRRWPRELIENIILNDVSSKDALHLRTFIKHPERTIHDISGISCSDGVMYHPTRGFYASLMTAAITKTPMGLAEYDLIPENAKIPKHLWVVDFVNRVYYGNTPFSLLPKSQIFSLTHEGTLKTETIHSAGREALTFSLLLEHHLKQTYNCAIERPDWGIRAQKLLRDIPTLAIPIYEKRKGDFFAHKAKYMEDDPEAVTATIEILEAIDYAYSHFDEHLGIKQLRESNNPFKRARIKAQELLSQHNYFVS